MNTLDVIIPVHSGERPIYRAVQSVLNSQLPEVRAIVVSHNIDSHVIAANLKELAQNPQLILLSFWDGIFSPAGPKNFGVSKSEASYITFLDSDDEYEHFAIENWISELKGQPDLLIGQLKSDISGTIFAPLPRFGRFKNLDAVSDLLFYRTAPQGVIIKRSLCELENFPNFTEGVINGEDALLTPYLMTHASQIHFSKSNLGYILHENEQNRITGVPLTLNQLFEPVLLLLGQDWVKNLSSREAISLAVFLSGISILGPLISKAQTQDLSQGDIDATLNVIVQIQKFSPNFNNYLSRYENKLLNAIKTNDKQLFREKVNNKASLRKGDSIITQDLSKSLSPESTLRKTLRKPFVKILFHTIHFFKT